MKSTFDHKTRMRIIFILLMLFISSMIVLLSSCNFDLFKSKSERRSDSTSVSNTIKGGKDSVSGGSVRKEDVKSKEEVEWWRIIQQFQPQGRDTTINNFYPQPTTIIYEKGKGNKEETINRIDSTWVIQMNQWWSVKFDSLNKKVELSEKEKKSSMRGVGLTTLLLVGLAVLIIPKLLTWVGSNYSISKKVIK